MRPDVAMLAAVPLFSDLPPEQLERLRSWFEIRSVDSGARLVGEGAAGYTFFVLQTGAARVVREGREIGTLAPGDHFGEMAILGDGRRTATVETTEPSTFLAMFGADFRQLEAALPETAAHIKETMQARLALYT